MARRALKKYTRAAASSLSAQDWLRAGIQAGQTASVVRKPRKKRARKILRSTAAMTRRIDAAAQKLDGVVQQGLRRNAAMQQAAQKREEQVKTAVRTATQRMDATAQRQAFQIRQQRLGTDVSQASTRVQNEQSNLQQHFKKLDGDLKLRAAKQKRKADEYRKNLLVDAYEWRRDKGLYQAEIKRQLRDFQRDRAATRGSLLENRQDLLGDASNARQTQKFQQRADQLGAQLQRANARTAQERARLAAKLSPISQQANVWGGSRIRQSEVFTAAADPLLKARQSSSYWTAPRTGGSVSRAWQVA